MSKIKDLMNDHLGAAMRHLDDDNGILNGLSIGNNFDLLCTEVTLSTRMTAERDSDFIRDYQLSLTVRQSDFIGDAEEFQGKIAVYKDINRRILIVRETSDSLQWIFDLGAEFGSSR